MGLFPDVREQFRQRENEFRLGAVTRFFRGNDVFHHAIRRIANIRAGFRGIASERRTSAGLWKGGFGQILRRFDVHEVTFASSARIAATVAP